MLGSEAPANHKGDILNIVSDGNHAWPTSRTDVSLDAGTSYTDPSCIIRGTTTTGTPAMTTIVPAAAGLHQMVRFRGTTKYAIVENLVFDATSQAADATEYTAVEWRDVTQGPHKVRYCAMLGGASGTMAGGSRFLQAVHTSGSSGDQGITEYCYFQNIRISSDTFGLEYRYDHCLYINDSGAARTGVIFQYGTLGASVPTSVVQVTNCTIYDDTTGATLKIILFTPATGVDAGTVTAHSNYVWVNTTGTVSPFFGGGAASTSVTHVGTINANVLLGGDDVASGDMAATGWYELPWDANDDDAVDPDTWPSDSVAYATPAADVFNDPTSTYAWEVPNGLTITVLKDLRPIQYKTSGLFGLTPGALPKIGDDAPTDETDPANVPFLDVRPFFAPVLLLEANVRLSTERNRNTEVYERSDRENETWREFTTRRFTLSTGSSERLNSGIETGQYLMSESDVAIRVNAGTIEDVYLPAAKQVIALGGNYTILKVKNEESATATLLLTMVD